MYLFMSKYTLSWLIGIIFLHKSAWVKWASVCNQIHMEVFKEVHVLWQYVVSTVASLGAVLSV